MYYVNVCHSAVDIDCPDCFVALRRTVVERKERTESLDPHALDFLLRGLTKKTK